MKISLILFALSVLSFVNAQQTYFEGKDLVCQPKNEQAQKTFDSAIKILHLNSSLDPKYLNANKELFFRATKEDSAFCDAYFFTGYTARLQNEFETALTFYYMADSLSTRPSLEFKQNLASTFLIYEAYDTAREKYNEIIEYFPSNPEGYYGYALTSIFLEDTEEGLQNINKAIAYYRQKGVRNFDDATYLKAILLTLNKKYQEAIPLFETVSGFKKEPNYYIHYSLALLKTAEANNDEKMKKKAKKFYDKIEEKTMIPENLMSLFKF